MGKAIRESYVESPTELIGKPLNFEVNIKNIKGLPKRFKNVFVEYKFGDGENVEYMSPKSKDVHTNFNIKFLNKFSWPTVTDTQLTTLQSGGIFTTVCANQRANDQGFADRKGQTTRWLVNDFRGIAQALPMRTAAPVKAISADTSAKSAAADAAHAAETKRLQNEAHQLNSRLELIKKICALAERQGKQTVPLELVQKALRDPNVSLPKSLPKDATEVEVREVIREIGGDNKSKSCTIMWA